jgi:hypothetical protein
MHTYLDAFVWGRGLSFGNAIAQLFYPALEHESLAPRHICTSDSLCTVKLACVVFCVVPFRSPSLHVFQCGIQSPLCVEIVTKFIDCGATVSYRLGVMLGFLSVAEW